ncbi:MAG: hypothetical protein PHR68_04925 [Candidatus Gracilibacteria bacterium]|nr:hypothetical protein [Candidatus Gracilibacteria bacterium]
MKVRNKSGIILFYAVILSLLVSILALIIVNKENIFISNLQYNYFDTKLFKNINSKSDIVNKDFINSGTGVYSNIKGYVKTKTDYNNVFWYNSKNSSFINTSNYSDITKIGNLGVGKIYIDLDNTAKLKYMEFDNNLYNSGGELKYLTGFELSFPTGSVGYLTDIGITSSGALAKQINFSDKNIALFLSYDNTIATKSSMDYLTYGIKIYDTFGNLIYSNPIKQIGGVTKYLGQDIIISKGSYYSKTIELVK